jgi:hypothetical protein
MRSPAVAPELTASRSVPLDAATLYPERDGFFARRAKARRAKLLAGVADVLGRALAPGETVRYLARGVRYWLREHLFGGAAVAYYHNQVALVVTDRRLLLVQLGARGRAGDLKHEVALAAIRGAGRSFLSGWRVRLADGTKLAFTRVPAADRKRLEALFPRATGPEAPRTSEASLVPLCPACLRPVPGPVGATLTCPQEGCRIPFRDPRKAARLSAVVPGLGDLYLRHHVFGALEFLGSMAMLAVGIAHALQAYVDGEAASLVTAAVALAFFIGLPRLVDYRLTLHMGRKGLVPLALAPAPGAQARNLPSYPRWAPLLFIAGIALTGIFAVAMSQDLRDDVVARQAGRLAAEGRLDDAHARWAEVVRRGGVTEARRVRFALALLEAGDAEGADALRAEFEGKGIDAALADRWNAALRREQAALSDYQEGLQALVAGDEAAWTRLDRALGYFEGVKRPHLPRSRGELRAHLAMGALAEPLRTVDLENAVRWLEGLEGAPAAERAAVEAAYASARGERARAAGALERLAGTPLPPSFQLLVLEARARLAEGEAARAAVRSAAEAFPPDGLDEEEQRRRQALVEAGR